MQTLTGDQISTAAEFAADFTTTNINPPTIDIEDPNYDNLACAWMRAMGLYEDAIAARVRPLMGGDPEDFDAEEILRAACEVPFKGEDTPAISDRDAATLDAAIAAAIAASQNGVPVTVSYWDTHSDSVNHGIVTRTYLNGELISEEAE